MKTIRKLMLALVFGTAGLSHGHAGEATNMTVFKTPWCGCCEAWTDAMKSLGYQVTIKNLEDLTAIKKQAGVPAALEGCHTAVLGDYIIEGHVPKNAIDKLLSERPAIRGLAVPGMPPGSLGMGDDPDATYTVYAFHRDPANPPAIYLNVGE